MPKAPCPPSFFSFPVTSGFKHTDRQIHTPTTPPLPTPLFAEQVYRAGRLNKAAVQWRSGAGHPGVPVPQMPRRRQCWQVTLETPPQKIGGVTERTIGGGVTRNSHGVTESAMAGSVVCVWCTIV